MKDWKTPKITPAGLGITQWAQKKNGKTVPNCVPGKTDESVNAAMGDLSEEETYKSIGQRMADDGVTYSPEREDEIIGLLVQYMKKSGMNPKTIRHLLNYDEDYIPDQLGYLPRKQDVAEATGDAKFDNMMRNIKKGSKKQATADRKAERAASTERAKNAFGPSPADKLTIKKGVAEGSEVTLPGKSKLGGATAAPAPNPALKNILLRHMDEVKIFVKYGEIDQTGPMFQDLYEYFANEIPEPVRRDPIRLERRIGNMIAPYAKFYTSTNRMNEQGVAENSVNEFAPSNQFNPNGGMSWSQFLGIINPTMKNWGFKITDKDDGSTMYIKVGTLEDEWFIIVLEPDGDMVMSTFGTVEEDSPYMNPPEFVSMDSHGAAELLKSIESDFGLDQNVAEGSGGQVTESPGVRLKDLANVATNMPDADFWLIRKGSSKAVGTPIKDFETGRIGIKVLRTDILDPKYLFYIIMHLHNQGYFASRANGATNLVNIKVSDVADIPFGQQGVAENFADGRNPQDKGDSKRHGVPTKSSVSTLRKVAKQGGRKGQLAHWMANMKAGRAKSHAAAEGANLDMVHHMIKEQPDDALSNLGSILANVRRITGQYQYADMHIDIITQVEKLALQAGINPTELKYYIDDILEKQREMEHAVNGLDEPFEYAVNKLADQNDGLAESQANKKKEISETETKKRKFEYKPIEQSVIKDPEEYARWRMLRELDHVFGPTQRHRANARNGMYKKNIATPRQWKLLFDMTDEYGNINPRVSNDFVGEELTGMTAMDNDIKSIDQGVDENSVKPIFKGHYVYNVTPADVQDAQAIGLKQARDGHWIIAVYNTSGTKTVLKKQSADRAFGTGKWIAANVMRENKQTAVGLNENRVYYHAVGTSEKQLRSEFQLQQDEYGWYLREDASPSLKLEALRTFGQPNSINFMVEYDLAAFSGSTQTLGPDNVVSPVGSLPKTQKKKGK